jgi:hypothetical protein
MNFIRLHAKFDRWRDSNEFHIHLSTGNINQLFGTRHILLSMSRRATVEFEALGFHYNSCLLNGPTSCGPVFCSINHQACRVYYAAQISLRLIIVNAIAHSTHAIIYDMCLAWRGDSCPSPASICLSLKIMCGLKSNSSAILSFTNSLSWKAPCLAT